MGVTPSWGHLISITLDFYTKIMFSLSVFEENICKLIGFLTCIEDMCLKGTRLSRGDFHTSWWDMPVLLYLISWQQHGLREPIFTSAYNVRPLPWLGLYSFVTELINIIHHQSPLVVDLNYYIDGCCIYKGEYHIHLSLGSILIYNPRERNHACVIFYLLCAKNIFEKDIKQHVNFGIKLLG
ncbi:hypothetical protein ACJX0J_034126 [Zea mays]